MSDNNLRRDAADAAAAEHRQISTQPRKYPFLYFPKDRGEKSRKEVERVWQEDPSNAKYKNRRKESFVITFTTLPTGGHLSAPFPQSLMIITALGDLNNDNGLPVLENIKTLPSGESLELDGDGVVKFSGKGGGLALLQIIDK